MISKRWKSDILSCRSFAEDVSSDHKLVLTKLQLRLKAGVRKPELKRYNLASLRDNTVKEEFEKSLQTTTSWTEESNVERIYVEFHPRRNTHNSRKGPRASTNE